MIITGDIPDCNTDKLFQIQIEIQTATDKKVNTISVSNFNADQTFWRRIAIFFGSKRRIIPIKFTNLDRVLYVKIADIKPYMEESTSIYPVATYQEDIPVTKEPTNKEILSVNLQSCAQESNNQITILDAYITDDDIDALSYAYKKIPQNVMNSILLDCKSEDSKQRMYRTFVAIDNTIKNSSNEPKRINRSQFESRNIHAYTIENSAVYIELSKLKNKSKPSDVFLGEGTSKLATKAIKISFDAEDEKFKVELVARTVPNPKIKTANFEDTKSIGCSNQSIEEEIKTRKLFEATENVVAAYHLTIQSKTKNRQNKTVCFEKLYISGDELVTDISLKDKLSALIGVGNGINEMHKKGYIHSDIKIDNCFLLNSKLRKEGFIGDLGMVTKIGTSLKGGSPSYMPPEALDFNPTTNEYIFKGLANTKIDSYSFGMTILASIAKEKSSLLFKTSALGLMKQQRTYEAELENCLNNLLSENQAQNEMLVICYRLMRFEPNLRISCEEAIELLKKIPIE